MTSNPSFCLYTSTLKYMAYNIYCDSSWLFLSFICSVLSSRLDSNVLNMNISQHCTDGRHQCLTEAPPSYSNLTQHSCSGSDSTKELLYLYKTCPIERVQFRQTKHNLMCFCFNNVFTDYHHQIMVLVKFFSTVL